VKKGQLIYRIFLVLIIGYFGISYLVGYGQGQKTGIVFAEILIKMFKILPCAFILIGLFEVWVKQETVMKHLGENSGLKGYVWVLLLAGFSIGGLYVAFPLAETLHKKGASLEIIFAYLGFAGVCRIPMTIFEISFLGLPFTLIRLLITIPLFLLIGILMGKILQKKNYELNLN